jgi:MFS family permease
MKWFGLFSANFLGVFNDNFLKNLAAFVAIYWIADEHRGLLISLSTAMLVIPYIFFSPLAGKLAKTQYKKNIMVWLKLAEIPIIIIACLGFYFQSILLILSAIFLMGFQSCIYSPAKYGLIRDIGGKQGISFGTGAIEMLIFIAVLGATITASYLSDNYNVYVAIFIMLILAVTGYLATLTINANEDAPEKSNDPINPVVFIQKTIVWAKQIKGLNPVIISVSSFWALASLIQLNLIRHCPFTMGLTNTQTGIIMALAAFGIGAGCYLAGVLSNHKIELGLVPIGGIGIAVCIILIVLLQPQVYVFTVLIILTAFFCGFYKVPLTAWIQDNVEGRQLGEIIAYNNLLDFIFIFIASLLFGLAEKFFGTYAVFIIVAIGAVFMIFFTALYIPDLWKSFTRKIKIS